MVPLSACWLRERVPVRRPSLGRDLIFEHLGGDQTEATDALQRCHVNRLTARVFRFDGTTAATTLRPIRDLIAFVESFAKDQGYNSARNVPAMCRLSSPDPRLPACNRPPSRRIS